MDYRPKILPRIYVVFGCFCLVGLLIIFNVLKIRFRDGARHATLIKKNFRIEQQRGVRGTLRASNGEVLVAPTVTYKGGIDPMVISERDMAQLPEACECIAAAIGKTPEHWQRKILDNRERKSEYLRLAGELSVLQYRSLKQCPILEKNRNVGGLIAIPREDRLYLYDGLAQVALGFVDEGHGKRGLEAYFEQQLSGDSLDVLYKRDSHGTFLPEDGPKMTPEPGHDLIVSLDTPTQELVENVLAKGIKDSGAKHGAAIVMEVKTGKIRAVSNLIKSRSGEIKNSSENFAVVERREMGSVMKPAAILSLLDQGKLHPNTEINIGDGIQYYRKQRFKDPVLYHGDTVITVARALQLSSNVAMLDLMTRHYQKPEDYVDVYLNRYGFKRPTGIELVGEKAPYYAPYSSVSLPNLGIGYALTVTPLQILNFYNTVANDGKYMKPSLVEAIVHEGGIIEEFPPEVINNSIVKHPNAIQEMQDMLRKVVSEGTAKNADSPMLDIAGKTGTALIYNQEEQWDVTDHVCTFAGYFPADNPLYSCIVSVYYPIYPDDPSGGKVAAPLVREIAEKMLLLHPELLPNVESDLKIIAESSIPEIKTAAQEDIMEVLVQASIPIERNYETEWVAPDVEGRVIAMKPSGELYQGQKIVPDVTGMGMREAVYILENKGLKVSAKGTGKVVEQFPKPGSSFQSNIVVNLALR